MKHERKQLKNLNLLLKELEPFVRSPQKLKTGRIKNFNLKPRELWGNWLLATFLTEFHGRQFTVVESLEYDRVKGDGIIINRDNPKEFFVTEHVSALENKYNPLPKGEDRIIQAIFHKINRGGEYMKNKVLIVFFDGAEEFILERVREEIKEKHNFLSVLCIGLLSYEEGEYAYILSQINKDFSVSFKITINSDFTGWRISHLN